MPSVEAANRQIEETGEFIGDIWHARRDCTVFPCLMHNSLLRDERGYTIGMIGTLRDITKRKQAEEKLKKSYEQLHKLAAHLQSIREEERTEIARDIHDELSQTLTGLKFDLSWLHNKILRAEDGASLIEKINSMSLILDNTIQWARRISMTLRPSVLDDLGLVAALEWQANEFQTRTGIACIFISFSESVFLDREKSTALFRICQESLTNVARHSDATAVTINLKEDGVNLILEVIDNGKGITETQITDTKSLGLLGMKERALILNGEFTVSGIPGKGTTVTVTIPI